MKVDVINSYIYPCNIQEKLLYLPVIYNQVFNHFLFLVFFGFLVFYFL